MKRSLKVIVALAVGATALTTTSCEKFLDINQNPNNPLTVTPESILGQSLKVTADNFSIGYNTYGNWTAGYWAKSGIVNGFSEERTYNYTSLYQQNLWISTYDNLYDYDLIERGAAAQNRTNLVAIAKIMKAYNFQLLVDQYGDIPYSQALKGLTNIVPKYDDDEAIYKDLIVKLTEATDAIAAIPDTERPVGSEDIMFRGDMAQWARFANSLKLRILLRQSGTSDGNISQYVRDEIAKLNGATFLNTDAQVQPGYLQADGQQNPFYNRYGVQPSGTASAVERNYVQPTQFIIDQYQDNKDLRLTRLYTAATDASVAGIYRGVTLGDPAVLGIAFYSRLRLGGGLLKGLDAPTPLFLAAESYLLRSEAKVRGLLTGGDDAKTDYQNGIKASFTYFYTANPGTAAAAAATLATTGATNYTKYLADNATNAKVSWDAATSTFAHQEQIYFQKYLALNTVASIEAWNEYRRTGYPRVQPGVLNKTFASSNGSISTRPDMLPVRLLYPQPEIATNLANVPKGINQFTSKIFWDVVD